MVSQSIVLPAGEVQPVTHAGILVMPLGLKYLEAYPDGNRSCTSGNRKDGPFLQEMEMEGILLVQKEYSHLGPQQCFSPGLCAPRFFAKKRDLHEYKFISNTARIQQEERRASSFALPFSGHFKEG